MELSEYIDEPTIAALQRLLPGMALQPILAPLPFPRSKLSITPRTNRPSDSIVSINLPAAPSADYYFRLYFRPEKQILAVLLNFETTGYFWYMPFEEVEYGDSDEVFLKTVDTLVSHETRIVQNRGVLCHSFACEYKSAGGWKYVYGESALRMGRFKVPPIKGRKWIYHSPALRG